MDFLTFLMAVPLLFAAFGIGIMVLVGIIWGCLTLFNKWGLLP